jgi:hypothetical protein
MQRRAGIGHIERLPSGSYRVHVYAGTGPLTGRALPRVDEEFSNDWAHFSFCAVHDPSPLGGKPAFSRLLGRYLVRGARNSRVPRFEEWDQDHEYPEFIYGTDRESGQPLSHTCDPEQLVL